MPPLSIDRRGFLIAGGVAAGAVALSGWPRRVLGQSATPRVGGSFTASQCAGSERWSNLSAGSVAIAMRAWSDCMSLAVDGPDTTMFGAGSMAAIGILGAAIHKESGLERTQVEIDFTHAEPGSPPRRFLAMSAHADDAAAAGLGCRVPADSGWLRLRLTAEAAGKDPLQQDIRLPLRRGVYAVSWSEDGHTSGRVRWANGGLETDWRCCVLVSIDSISASADK